MSSSGRSTCASPAGDRREQNSTQGRKGAKAQRRKNKNPTFAPLRLCAFALISGLPDRHEAAKHTKAVMPWRLLQ
jgi:hypothetical protein